jgi:hypothetical protein
MKGGETLVEEEEDWEEEEWEEDWEDEEEEEW